IRHSATRCHNHPQKLRKTWLVRETNVKRIAGWRAIDPHSIAHFTILTQGQFRKVAAGAGLKRVADAGQSARPVLCITKHAETR
ncbi:MAG: hypothetical protein ACKPJD_10980, partial [Planctomycetaceae bacterium]